MSFKAEWERTKRDINKVKEEMREGKNKFVQDLRDTRVKTKEQYEKDKIKRDENLKERKSAKVKTPKKSGFIVMLEALWTFIMAIPLIGITILAILFFIALFIM